MRNNDFARKNRVGIYSDSGSPIHEVLSPTVMRDGSVVLEKVGEENTDVVIQSYRDSTELSTVLARFANGDTSALNRYEGFYADVSEIPKDHRAALQKVMDAELAFNALPLSLREQYGNNWRAWLVDAGSDDWINRMTAILQPDTGSASDSGSDSEPVSDPER